MQGVYILRFPGTHKVYVDWAHSLEFTATDVADNLADTIGHPKLLEAYKLYGRPKITYIELRGSAAWYLHAQACYFMRQFNSVADGFNEPDQYLDLEEQKAPDLIEPPVVERALDSVIRIQAEVAALRRTLSP